MTTAAKTASGPGGTDRYAARRSPVSTRRTPPPRSHRQPVPRGRRSYRDAASHSSAHAHTRTSRRRPLPSSARVVSTGNETPCRIFSLRSGRDSWRRAAVTYTLYLVVVFVRLVLPVRGVFSVVFSNIYFVSLATVITVVVVFGAFISLLKNHRFRRRSARARYNHVRRIPLFTCSCSSSWLLSSQQRLLPRRRVGPISVSAIQKHFHGFSRKHDYSSSSSSLAVINETLLSSCRVAPANMSPLWERWHGVCVCCVCRSSSSESVWRRSCRSGRVPGDWRAPCLCCTLRRGPTATGWRTSPSRNRS